MRPQSLRSRLFLLIVLPLVLVAVTAAVIRYQVARSTSEALYDKTLLAIALTISRDVVLSEGDLLAEQLLERVTEALGDQVFYHVTAPDGVTITGYADPPNAAGETALKPGIPRFHDDVYHGDAVRVVTLREFIGAAPFGGWVTVQVWQTVNQRAALSLSIAARAGLMMAIVIAAAGAVVWFGIQLGLRPLFELRAAVAKRSPEDLSPIRRRVPREVEALVGAMNSLFERLARAFEERDAFISAAAHQLRNPVAGIQAQAEAAGGARDEAQMRRRLADVVEAARRASRLTQQLLSMESARGRHETMHDIDLAALVAETTRRHAADAVRRGVYLSFEVEGTPRPVHGDPVLLSEALQNLLDNAARYGCADGGAIRVQLRYADDEVLLAVEDDGPGVPETERERVFERFHRAGDGVDDGCGLGLTIVREIAERHGGRASLAASRGGARFELHLPATTTIAQARGRPRRRYNP